MIVQTGVGLLVTLASAALLNYAYLVEHGAASRLPALSARHPLRTLRILLSNRRWLLGFVSEGCAWGLYVLAVALAPLALVQAVSAAGIGILAVLASRLTGVSLAPRERRGVWLAILGLALLGVSLAGGSDEGTRGDWFEVLLWVAASFGVAGVAIRAARRFDAGVANGIATGIFFAAGDVATKTVVHGGARLAFVPAMLAAYGFGTICLQLGFQKASALKTAGIATLLTNALPIAAGMTIYDEPLPGGVYGALRVVSFFAVVVGAVALARPDKTKDDLGATGGSRSAAGELAKTAV